MRRKTLYKFILLIMVTVATAIAIVSIVIFPIISSRIAKRSFARSAPGPSATGTIPAAIPSYGYTRQIFTNVQGQSLVYYLYIPKNYNPQQKYPVVLLLHGDGEKIVPRKTEAQNQTRLLRLPYVRVWTTGFSIPGSPQVQLHWPSFIVVPQITTAERWIDGVIHMGFYVPTKKPSIALSLTKQLMGTLPYAYPGIDEKRRYITGITSGAYGVWDAIERWPDYFAAAVPIAGVGNPLQVAVLKNLPIWVFHGARDHVVDVSCSRIMIRAIREAGGKPRYTEFPTLAHGTWYDAYSLPGAPEPVAGFFSWFFAQKK